MIPYQVFEGWVYKEPELRYTSSNTPVVQVKFNAKDSKRNEQTGEWEQVRIAWLELTAWNNLADTAARQIHKGDEIVCCGKLVTRQWEHEGQKHMKNVIEQVQWIAKKIKPETTNTANASDEPPF